MNATIDNAPKAKLSKLVEFVEEWTDRKMSDTRRAVYESACERLSDAVEDWYAGLEDVEGSTARIRTPDWVKRIRRIGRED